VDLGERARVDYEQTLSAWRLLTEIRFKLLALVPTIAGTAIALLSTRGIDGWAAAMFSLLGLFVTLGIVFYDQRNTQLYNRLLGRAKFLESADVLDLPYPPEDEPTQGGLVRSRPTEPRRLLGLVEMRHDRALAVIYGSVLGAWTFPFIQAIAPSQLWLAGTLAIVLGVLWIGELQYVGRTRRELEKNDLLEKTYGRLHRRLGATHH
jgi:hypothetical protein